MPSQEQAKACAILAAAGIGSRFAKSGGYQPKQFLQLAGRPIYQWPLLQLYNHEQVDRIVIMTLAEMVPAIQSEINDFARAGRISVQVGGSTRQESVRLGLESLAKAGKKPEMVLVHDAARPFLSKQMISAAIEAVEKYGACTAAIPASDTIKRIERNQVVQTLDRNELVLVQTPQAARFDWLVSAHEHALKNSLDATDDAALLEAAGFTVTVIAGSKLNLKLTEPEDLLLAEAIAAVSGF
jgi:2-C-methyl-D-erythritol 4-phosphate cytidylyltransferase